MWSMGLSKTARRRGIDVSDLVKRLRDLADFRCDDLSIASDAAEEVERLREEVRRLSALITEPEKTPAGYNTPPNGEPCNIEDWNAGYAAGLADAIPPSAEHRPLQQAGAGDQAIYGQIAASYAANAEPVAWQHKDGQLSCRLPGGSVAGDWTPLYLAPPSADAKDAALEQARNALTVAAETISALETSGDLDTETMPILMAAIDATIDAATQKGGV